MDVLTHMDIHKISCYSHARISLLEIISSFYIGENNETACIPFSVYEAFFEL